MFSKIEKKILKRNLLLSCKKIGRIFSSSQIPYEKLQIGEEEVSLENYQNIKVFEQEKFASCGPSILKTIFVYLLRKYHKKVKRDEKIEEKDFYSHSHLAKITVEFLGIPPKILIKGIEKELKKYDLAYFPVIKKALKYEEIKQELRKQNCLIFSHMGNTHLHPHILRKKICKHNIYDLHYFLLLALNEKTKTVVVADPFGKQQELSLREFRERISLNKKYLTSRGGIYYAGVKTRVIPVRMAMILRKYP